MKSFKKIDGWIWEMDGKGRVRVFFESQLNLGYTLL